MTGHRRGAGATNAIAAVVGLLGVGAIVLGSWWWATEPPAASPPVAPTTSATAEPPPRPREVAEAVVVKPVPGAPQQVVIPSLGVRAPVQPIETQSGTLIPPSDPMQLGWWAGGAMPGAERGSTLVTGHTMHAGDGALNDLEQLVPGDRVRVDTEHGAVHYEVASTEIFTKGDLARDAERLFDQQAPGRLVLVTCEDWDGTQYLSNVVVTAVPT